MEKVKLRRDTSANWNAANPILEVGEIGLSINSGRFKIGDGTTYWNNLSYADVKGPAFIAAYTIAQTLLLTPVNYANAMVMVSDAIGGPKPAYCDGLAWYYFNDNPVI